MKTITGTKNINDHFAQIGLKIKEEVKYMLSISSSHNVSIGTIYKPLLSWKGKVSSKQIKVSFFTDKNVIKTITKSDKDYMLQIEFLKEGTSVILSNYFRGDEDKDWRGQKVGLNTKEVILVSLLLNASEGKGPFYFMNDLTKNCASDNGLQKFFTAIN